MSAFTDIREYVAIPRVLSLRLSPDGSRLISTVQSLNPDGKSYGTALWAIPLDGEPYRLTRSAKGETAAVFTAAGDVLFTSARPDPTVKDSTDEVPALWLLPRAGGEARQVAARPGGIAAVRTAGDVVVFASDVLDGEEAAEEEKRRARKEAGISAILHEGSPVRYWDHDLGPGRTRLFAARLGDDRLEDVRDLTPDAGDALRDASFELTPDGTGVITTWRVYLPKGEMRTDLVVIDVATGERRTLLSDDAHDFTHPIAVSPDGARVACSRERHTGWDISATSELWIADLATGEGHAYAPGLFAGDLEWAPDSSAVYVAADHQGRRPIFRVPLADRRNSRRESEGRANEERSGRDHEHGEVSRLTGDDAAYIGLNASADGRFLYALRSAVNLAPAPARIDVATGEITDLPSPAPRPEVRGTLTEISATADDGATIRGWLALPEGASAADPAPFVLFIHGGPLGSWNDWQWRWQSWIMAEHGYAVLMPDPCLSTGYGQDMIDRGWGNWGPRTQADLDAIVDVALARDDIDSERVAAMGGSFGGYMANWIAGHSDRYKAIVTHASLWNLDQFAGTTDAPMYWQREFGAPGSERYDLLSPHAALDKITTPMLVIHGDKDYRVPIGEALRLWWDLRRSEVESKFLYFPDENHWILKPGNIVAWYETVLAFLGQHVLGQEWKRPDSVA
ncbi:dipeptidyl aminopeptidase/acylaminoacyl peptidase [Nonomuraea polychroma]|uniref:Dipeptidyl aminopeptidase/acylaminoacyl peptidase n=1 Tax=Nonomuraea polychroma TaxID=46176 RepID=A0A438MC28_9ACTN|nr:alpha/beta fold hydrolase [Nonomuraea polychroma]RVX43205.1 dipeptidyl aminopeptidase/acylaminoacyl peptidase [Nonomuraea polychroma]